MILNGRSEGRKGEFNASGNFTDDIHFFFAFKHFKIIPFSTGYKRPNATVKVYLQAISKNYKSFFFFFNTYYMFSISHAYKFW